MKNHYSWLNLVFFIIFNLSINQAQSSSIHFVKINCNLPDNAGSITGNDKVCYGETISYSVPAIALATSYYWTLPTGAYIASGANTNSIMVVFKGASASGYLTVEGVNTCGNGVSSSLYVTVNPIPKLTLISSQKYCCNDGNIPLGSSTFASPNGGTWSCRQNSSFVKSNVFQTDLACDPKKSGIYSIYYAYQDPATSCMNKDSTKFTINPLPAVKFVGGTICQDIEKIPLHFPKNLYIKVPLNLNYMVDVQFKLLKSLPKVGGGFCTTNELIKDEDYSLNYNWWLTVSKSIIDIGSKIKDSLIVEITIQDINGCYNKDTATFVIVQVPEISFNGIPELCINAGKINLTKMYNVKPIGGYWGISKNPNMYRDSTFLIPGMKGYDTLNTLLLNIQNGPGIYLISYIHTASGCPVKKDTILRINPLPNVKISLSPSGDNGKYCETDQDITLIASLSGGIWTSSVSGVISGGKFKPSSVSASERDKWITLTYYYINSITKCDTSKSLKVFVQSKPIVNIITPDYDSCRSNAMNFKLEVVKQFTQKITWYHSADPLRASFENNSQSSILNPATFMIMPRSDSSTTVLITCQTDAEGVCPFSQDVLSITIHPVPHAFVTIDDPDGCEPHTVNFTSRITNGVDSSNATYNWKFSDAPDANTQNAYHTYGNARLYRDSLLITSEFGCDTLIKPSAISVYPIPIADFTSKPNSKAMISLPKFKFIDKSKGKELILGSKIVSYSWDFGDYSSSTDTSSKPNPEYYYPSDTGHYYVKLIVETNYGCSDSVKKSVIVIPDSPFQFVIYSNPNKGKFSIEINKQGNYSLRIYSIDGKLILEKQIEGYTIEDVDKRLSKGNYVISIEDSNANIVNKKMVVE